MFLWRLGSVVRAKIEGDVGPICLAILNQYGANQFVLMSGQSKSETTTCIGSSQSS